MIHKKKKEKQQPVVSRGGRRLYLGSKTGTLKSCHAVLVTRQFPVSQYSVCDVMAW